MGFALDFNWLMLKRIRKTCIRMEPGIQKHSIELKSHMLLNRRKHGLVM